MIEHATRAVLLVLSLMACTGISACDSQAAARVAPAPAVLPAAAWDESPNPAIHEPFDETPITPVETVGASRSE